MLQLTQLLAENPDLALYAKYRDYAPGHVPEQHLLPIDDPSNNDVERNYEPPEGLPYTPDDIEGLDPPAAGMGSWRQQRSWTDLILW